MEVEHQIFHDNRLKTIIDDALSFISGTDLYPMPLSSDFSGSGVYLLYYDGEHEVYSKLCELRIKKQMVPIYVGKAVPPGWRQGRNFEFFGAWSENMRQLGNAVPVDLGRSLGLSVSKVL